MNDEEIEEFLQHFADDFDVEPFIQAVTVNDFERFKGLVDSEDACIHIENDMLLYYIIYLDRWEMFSYALESPHFNCAFLDNLSRTVLMNLAFIPDKEKYAEALIAKGTDVNWSDRSSLTYLHLAALNPKLDHAKLVQMMLEHGADINAQDEGEKTPLFIACDCKNHAFVHLMLYHGADPNIPNFRGILPIVVAPDDLHDVLFYYTFDEKVSVRLSTLSRALCCESDLFERVVEKTEDVCFGWNDLRDFPEYLRNAVPRNVKLFLERFGEVVEELNARSALLVPVLKTCTKSVIDVFLESVHCAELVQAIKAPHSAIEYLTTRLKQDDVAELAYVMLSYGLELTSKDLDSVFDNYGFCDLFRILLQMDITILNDEEAHYSIARLYYDFNCNIERFAIGATATTFFRILKLYNHATLKELCLALDDQKIVDRVKTLPEVSSLVELSRDAARKCIINSFNVKNSRQFYTVLKLLPIGELNKKIIGLERYVNWI